MKLLICEIVTVFLSIKMPSIHGWFNVEKENKNESDMKDSATSVHWYLRYMSQISEIGKIGTKLTSWTEKS